MNAAKYVKSVHGNDVKVYAWEAGDVYSLVHMFGPKDLGGRGDVSKEIEDELRRTGKAHDEVVLMVCSFLPNIGVADCDPSLDRLPRPLAMESLFASRLSLQCMSTNSSLRTYVMSTARPLVSNVASDCCHRSPVPTSNGSRYLNLPSRL